MAAALSWVSALSSCDPKTNLSCVVHSTGAEYGVCSHMATNSFLSQNSADTVCSAPNLYAAGRQSVRREVRSLSAEQWRRVVDAIWITRNLTFAEGVAKCAAPRRGFVAACHTLKRRCCRRRAAGTARSSSHTTPWCCGTL